MAKKFSGFSPKLVKFLKDLKKNNNREWFQEHKPRYENDVLEPALDFIEAMASPLEKFAPEFVAIPKRSGGSLMRVYRDTRFAKDKTPYKTNVGIQFRHELGKDVHAPGYYFHIDPDNVFLAAGIWHPESATLGKIRDAIVEIPAEWKKARDNQAFKKHFALEGDSLKRPPRGYDAEHKYIEDLKRKDFIAVKSLSHKAVYAEDIVKSVAGAFNAATPLMKFLCRASEVPY